MTHDENDPLRDRGSEARYDDPRYDDPRYDCDTDDAGFEKIRRGEKGNFPTSNERKARRSAKETFGSKKVRKSISSKGGMHRRRKKRIV